MVRVWYFLFAVTERKEVSQISAVRDYHDLFQLSLRRQPGNEFATALKDFRARFAFVYVVKVERVLLRSHQSKVDVLERRSEEGSVPPPVARMQARLLAQ